MTREQLMLNIIEKYAIHTMYCPYWGTPDEGDKDCTCGLTQARQSLRSAPTEGVGVLDRVETCPCKRCTMIRSVIASEKQDVVGGSATSMTMWVVYKNPKDFPDDFVIRQWLGTEPKDIVAKAKTLELVRRQLPAGVTGPFLPDANDDPVIVEMWI